MPSHPQPFPHSLASAPSPLPTPGGADLLLVSSPGPPPLPSEAPLLAPISLARVSKITQRLCLPLLPLPALFSQLLQQGGWACLGPGSGVSPSSWSFPGPASKLSFPSCTPLPPPFSLPVSIFPHLSFPLSLSSSLSHSIFLSAFSPFLAYCFETTKNYTWPQFPLGERGSQHPRSSFWC